MRLQISTVCGAHDCTVGHYSRLRKRGKNSTMYERQKNLETYKFVKHKSVGARRKIRNQQRRWNRYYFINALPNKTRVEFAKVCFYFHEPKPTLVYEPIWPFLGPLLSPLKFFLIFTLTAYYNIIQCLLCLSPLLFNSS